jgi:hypothetical protein
MSRLQRALGKAAAYPAKRQWCRRTQGSPACNAAADVPSRVPLLRSSEGGRAASLRYDEAPGPADRGDAPAALGGSANAIALPSGSGMFTWRTPFE